MEKFTKLGLSKELTDVLKREGFTEPTEIQEKAIPIALKGKDIIGGSATGSGKTLAFAAPIIENLKPNREVQALILTPTRELAEQVANSIRNFGRNKKLNVLAVYGGVKIDPQMRKLAVADVVVGTPGRILDHLNRRTLRLDEIKFLVLDEVDRMFDMGFSRDVEKILKECSTDRQTMMFSATISADIDNLAKKYTDKPIEIAVASHVDPSKLKQVYYDVPDNKKFSLLVSLLKEETSELVMVFCSTRRNVDFVADNLIRNKIHAKAIHGGLDQKKRIRVLEEFHKKGLGVLVCTDVAARGLDIKGVSHVYNYDVPHDATDYIHRIGRTARAGKEGKAMTILASRDYEKFGSLIQSKEIHIASKKLPQLEIVRIQITQGRDNDRFGRNPRGKDFGRNPRGNSRGGSSYGKDRPSRGGSYGRKPSSGRYNRDSRDSSRNSGRSSYGRKPSSGGSSYHKRSDSRDSGKRSYGGRPSGGRSYGRDSGRDRPRSGSSYGRKPSFGGNRSGGSYHKRSDSRSSNQDSNRSRPSSRRPSNRGRNDSRSSGRPRRR
jgi:ATP-dependent RNA helicase DeaD